MCKRDPSLFAPPLLGGWADLDRSPLMSWFRQLMADSMAVLSPPEPSCFFPFPPHIGDCWVYGTPTLGPQAPSFQVPLTWWFGVVWIGI